MGQMIAITPYKETIVPHPVAILIYLSQIYSYYIWGNMSPLGLIETNVLRSRLVYGRTL